MVLSDLDKRWFAVQVKPRFEKSVAAILEGKGYEQILPVCPAPFDGSRRRADRPLFPGYVFCRFDSQVLGPIVTTPGVIRIVGFGNSPASVSESEMEAIRTILNTSLAVKPYPYLPGVQMVRIVQGPLRGVQGVIVGRGKKSLLVVSIHLLQRSLAVEFPPDMLNSVDRPWTIQQEKERTAGGSSL